MLTEKAKEAKKGVIIVQDNNPRDLVLQQSKNLMSVESYNANSIYNIVFGMAVIRDVA